MIFGRFWSIADSWRYSLSWFELNLGDRRFIRLGRVWFLMILMKEQSEWVWLGSRKKEREREDWRLTLWLFWWWSKWQLQLQLQVFSIQDHHAVSQVLWRNLLLLSLPSPTVIGATAARCLPLPSCVMPAMSDRHMWSHYRGLDASLSSDLIQSIVFAISDYSPEKTESI